MNFETIYIRELYDQVIADLNYSGRKLITVIRDSKGIKTITKDLMTVVGFEVNGSKDDQWYVDLEKEVINLSGHEFLPKIQEFIGSEVELNKESLFE
ncbi:hypothetical protein [Membranihabitans marinus]|uniref:hypothetical protein n=1 Tax=Membranihabitans marinus TaxID=1227546 RepID=UPI001F20B3A5|nr:hypothetical protein [Membranihabitans marinus]